MSPAIIVDVALVVSLATGITPGGRWVTTATLEITKQYNYTVTDTLILLINAQNSLLYGTIHHPTSYPHADCTYLSTIVWAVPPIQWVGSRPARDTSWQ